MSDFGEPWIAQDVPAYDNQHRTLQIIPSECGLTGNYLTTTIREAVRIVDSVNACTGLTLNVELGTVQRLVEAAKLSDYSKRTEQDGAINGTN